MEEEIEKDFFLNTNILLSFFHFSKFAIKFVEGIEILFGDSSC